MAEAFSREDAHSFFKDIWELYRETDRRFKETDRQFKETDRKIQEVSRQIGALGGRLGEFVEHMVKPAVIRLFRERGLNVHETLTDICGYDDDGNLKLQIDILAINQKEAIAVECKSKCLEDDVNEHMERLGKIKKFLPRYGEYKILGAVAAMVMPEDVGKYAYRKGLYVLVQNGDVVEIKNDDKFKPKVW